MGTTTRSVLIAGLAAVAATAVAVTTVAPTASAAKPLARAELMTAGGEVVGEVVFMGFGNHIDRAKIVIEAPDIDNRGTYHGIHVHAVGRCLDPAGQPAFGLAGPHWNPTGVHHGHHKGDLPSVLIDEDGRGYLDTETPRFTVDELFDADGSSVVLHASGDNFAHLPGYHPNEVTLATGDGGPRYACGVVTR